jgi:hypothetical protein
MTIIDSLKDLLSAARSAAGRLHAADQKLRHEIATLEAEESVLLSAPAPAEDVTATLRRLIDEAAATWRATHGAAIRAAASGQIERLPGRAEQRGPDVVREGSWPDGVTLQLAGLAPVTFSGLCGLIPELVLAGLLVAVEATPAAGERPPMAARLRRLEEIAAAIARLQGEHDRLVTAAAEVHVSLAPLPENEALRVQAAQHQEFVDLNNRLNADMIRTGRAEPMR